MGIVPASKYAGTVDPQSTVLIFGHYDLRGSFRSQRVSVCSAAIAG